MNEESPTKPAAGPPPTFEPMGQVECPKCGANVTLPANVCPVCHKHLYLLCPECEEPNFRANVHCDYCGAVLRGADRPKPMIHRHVWPFSWRVDPQRKWLLPTQMALFVSSVALTTLAVIKLVEYRQSQKPPATPEVYVLENGKLRPLEEVLKK